MATDKDFIIKNGLVVGGEITANGGIALGDNDKATFNSNLNIFSTGTSSYIEEVGAGDLYLKASSLYITDRDNNQFMTLIDNGTGGTVSLMHNTATKLATTSTGIDVTGTATMDGLTVENNTTDVKGTVKNTLTAGTRTATLDILPQNDGAYGVSIQASGGSGTGTFQFNNKNIMKFDFNNDISFYEDTGSTAKFFWDASEERLGIGTTSPSTALDISATTGAIKTTSSTGTNIAYNAILNTGGGLYLGLEQSTGGGLFAGTSGYDAVLGHTGAYKMHFATSNTIRTTIDSSGNVGIGTTSPITALHAGTTGGNAYSSTITKSSNMKGGIFTQASNGDDMVGVYFATGSTTAGTHWSGITGSRSDNASHWGTQLNFYTHNNDVANLNDATQKMVIKGDGNVGIGTTSPAARLSILGTSGTYPTAFIGHSLVDTSGEALRIGRSDNQTIRYHSINATQSQTSGDNTLSFSLHNASTSTSQTQVMTLKGDGNVGIGTNNPTLKLDLSSSTSFGLPGTSGTTPVGFARIGYNDRTWSGNEILMGIINASANNYAGYIQCKVPTDYSATRPFLINPQGGNVGIGTDTPAQKLHVSGGNVRIDTDTNSTLTISDGGTDAVNLLASTGDELYIGANNAYKLRFKTDGNIVMDNGGSLGIGTSSPTQKITIADAYPYIHFNNTSNVTQGSIGYNSGLSAVTFGTETSIPLRFHINSVEAMRIDGNTGNVTTTGEILINGTYDANPYGNAGARLRFCGGTEPQDYYIGTNLEDVGGNYSKLDLRWHTGIRMGAQGVYGGIRFYNNEDLTSKLMSIGEGSGVTDVKVYNDLNVVSNIEINGTTVIDASRNLSNINAGTFGQDISAMDTTYLDLEVVNSMSIRGSSALYFGITTNNYNSWKTRMLNDNTSTMQINAQALNFNNTGYGSTTFFLANSTGFDIKTGSLLINAQTVIDSSRNLTNIASYNGYAPSQSSSSTNSVYSADTRNVNTAPSGINRGLYVDFKTQSVIGLTGSGTYAGVLTFRSYGSGTDLSGGYPIQIAYDQAGNLQTRYGSSSSAWGSWKAIHLAGNDLSAGTISSGAITTSGTFTKTFDVGNSITIGNDVTYGIDGTGRYVTLGFGGNANGSNRIFAHNTGGDGIYIAAATSRDINFRTNGSAQNAFRISSTGTVDMGASNTTVIDASRNITNIVGGEIGNSTDSRGILTLNHDTTATTTSGVGTGADIGDGNRLLTLNNPNSNGTASNYVALGFNLNPSVSDYRCMADIKLLRTTLNSSANDLVFTQRHSDGVFYNNLVINSSGNVSIRGNFTASGNVTAYSDERLKTNIQTLDGKKALQMRGVSFIKDGVEGSGVIAQEIEKIAPELVITADDEMGTKSVAYGNLVGYLIEAVKEQQKQIEELKEEVSSLRSKI